MIGLLSFPRTNGPDTTEMEREQEDGHKEDGKVTFQKDGAD